LSKKAGADNVVPYQENEEQFLKNLKHEEGDLLDNAIVFAPSDKVMNTAIRAVKRRGVMVLDVRGNVANIPTFEEKTVKDSNIGTRKDMADLFKMASEYGLRVVMKLRCL
jgi:propanol-preferring alcohol dehydrogenase